MMRKADSGTISRNRTLFKTVDRDDTLVARAANPRTGLITPAATSVSSSTKEGYLGPAVDVSQSAQWTLHNNQWISVERGTNLDAIEKVGYEKIGTDKPLHATNSGFDNQVVPQQVTTGSAFVAALRLAHQTVRRKAVGSPARAVPDRSRSNDAGLGFRSTAAEHRISSAAIVSQHSETKHGGLPHGLAVISESQTAQADHFNRQIARLRHGAKRDMSQFGTDHLLPQRMEDGPYPATSVMGRSLRLHGSATLDARGRGQHRTGGIQVSPAQHRGVRRIYRQPTPPWMKPKGTLIGPRNITNDGTPQRLHGYSEGRSPAYGQYSEGEARTTQPRRGSPVRSFSQPYVHMCTNLDSANSVPARQIQARLLESDAWTTESHEPLPTNTLEHAHTMPDLYLNSNQEHSVATQDAVPLSRPTMPSRKMGMVPVPTVTENPGFEQRQTESDVIDTGHNYTAVCSGALLEQIDLPNVQHHAIRRRGSSVQLPVPAFQLVRAAATAHGHDKCCPRCCRDHGCHDGCLGHVRKTNDSIDVNDSNSKAVAGSDHASISSLENSIKSLHEFNARKASKMAKIRAMFVPSARDEPVLTPFDMLDEPRAPLKDTLREPTESPPQTILARRAAEEAKSATPKVTSPGALNAARTVMDAPASPKPRPSGPRIEKGAVKVKEFRDKTDHDETIVSAALRHTANAGKRMITRHEDVVLEGGESSTKSQDRTVTSQSPSTRKRFSFSSTISDLYPVRLLLLRERYSVLNETASLLLDKTLAMLSVMFTTTSTLATIALDYNRTRVLQLPKDVTGTELAAGCLKSALYLMVCAGMMTGILRLLAFFIAVLRIILLPLKVVAWIIG